MAFPASDLGLMVEMALGADLTTADLTSWTTWTDISRYVRFADGITITRGRADEFSTAAPAKAALTLLNDGRFVSRNPTGAYYGTIGPNTPLRILVRPDTNLITDAFGRSTSGSWGSADAGGAWTLTVAADCSVQSTFGRMTLTAGRHSAYLAATSLTTLDLTVRARTSQLATGGPLAVGALFRLADTSNFHRLNLACNTDQSMTLSLIDRVASVDTTIGTAATGLTHVANTWYRLRVQSVGTSGSFLRAKAWLDGTTEPSTWMVYAATAAAPTSGFPGLFGIKETGNTNVSANVEFDDFSVRDGWLCRHTGYVDVLPTRWNDAGLKQMLAPVAASGLTRRLGQGGTIRSAIKAGVASQSRPPRAYWPMEDKSGSKSIASGLASGRPMTITGPVSLGTGQAAGSDPLAVVTATQLLTGTVVPYSVTGEWQIMFLINIPAATAGEQALLRWYTSGTYPVWQLVLTPSGGTDTLQLRAYTSAFVESLGDPGVPFTGEPYGSQLWFQVTADTSGSDLAWTYSLFAGGDVLQSTGGTKVSASPATVRSVAFGNGAGADQLAGSTLGHISVWDTITPSLGAYASVGWGTEPSHTRWLRLGMQESVPTSLASTPGTDFAIMGAPASNTLLAQLREVETAEVGIAYDETDGSVALLPRSARFGQAVALTLDVSQHQVGWPIEPADDDQQLHNDVTSSQPSGSSYQYTDRTSALAVTKVGFYPLPRTVNLFNATDLRQDAEFAVALGTVDDLRYPQIPIDLGRNPSLIPSWLALNVGARAQVTHPPSALTPDTIDVIIEGWTERLDTKRWTATLNTSSARPWNAWTVATGIGNRSRLGSGASTLAAGVTSSATSLSVATSAGNPLWVTGAVNFDIGIAGERMTVTNISGSSSPQTFTVVRHVNGVVKAQTATDPLGVATKVDLWQPSIWAH